MKKTLLVDIGNSTTEYAQYTVKKTFVNQKRIPTATLELVFTPEWLAQFSKIVVSSVVPKADVLFKHHPQTTFITYQNIPSKINLKKPAEAGADRLVNAVAAFALTQSETLIIDSGTAITFCYVSKEGVYEGGAIFPGMGICSKALHVYTAKIPYISVRPHIAKIGKTTKEAVQIGLYHGFIAMISGMIQSYKIQYPNLTVIGTGRGLSVLKESLPLDRYEPNLILQGLAICSKL